MFSLIWVSLDSVLDTVPKESANILKMVMNLSKKYKTQVIFSLKEMLMGLLKGRREFKKWNRAC